MEVDTQIVVKTEPRDEDSYRDQLEDDDGNEESGDGADFIPTSNNDEENDDEEYSSQLEDSILNAVSILNQDDELETVEEAVIVKTERFIADEEANDNCQDEVEAPHVPATRRSTRKRKTTSFNKSFEVEEDNEAEDYDGGGGGGGGVENDKSKRKRSSQMIQSKPIPRQRPGPKSRKVIAMPKTKPGRRGRISVPISELERNADKILVVPLARCDKQKTNLLSTSSKPSSSLATTATPSQMDRFACQDCQKPFPTLEAVSKHLSHLSDEYGDEIPCSVCESTFQRLACLEYHISTHFKVKCRFCDVFFTRDQDLFDHFTSLHLQKRSSAPLESVVDDFNEVPVKNINSESVYEENSPLADVDHFDDDVTSDFGGVDDDFNEADEEEPADDPDYAEKPSPPPKRGRGRPRIHPVVLAPPKMKLKKKLSKKKKEKLKKQMKLKKQKEKSTAGEEDVSAEPPPPKKKGGRPPKVWDPQELWELKRKQEARRKAVLKRMKDQVKKAKSNRKKNAKKRNQDDIQIQLQGEEKKPEKAQPLSHQDFLRAHRIHRVITSSDLISKGMSTSDPCLKRCSPSVGNGTFENPFWVLKNDSELHCICPACGRTFRSRKELSTHHQQSHSLICGSCSICGKPQVKFSRLNRHMKSHCNSDELKIRYEQEIQAEGQPAPKQEDRLYKCVHCSKILIGWLPLTVHEKYWHDIEAGGEEEYPKRRRGRERKSFICELCGKSVKTEHNLKKHKKKHKRAMKRAAEGKSEENPRRRESYDDQAMCPTCGKVFKNNKSLKNHERYKHSEERMAAAAIAAEPMDCPICGRPFTGRRFMHTHMPTHLNKEEKLLFNNWNGTLQEFIEHLGSGEPKLNVEEEEDEDSRDEAGTGYQHHQNQVGGGSSSSANPFAGGMTGMNFLNSYAASNSAYLSVFAPR